MKSWSELLAVDHVLKRELLAVRTEHVMTKQLCWHCCHEIVGPTLQYPLSYDQKLDVFKVVGQFCSFECMKGYSRDRKPAFSTGQRDVTIYYYKRRLTGSYSRVVSAPPREALKAFGGHMTIEEFRRPNAKIGFITNLDKLAKMIPYEMYEYKQSVQNIQTVRENKRVDIVTSSAGADNLKLRRPRPLANNNGTIDKILGLNLDVVIKK
jgi:hypothetical protein